MGVPCMSCPFLAVQPDNVIRHAMQHLVVLSHHETANMGFCQELVKERASQRADSGLQKKTLHHGWTFQGARPAPGRLHGNIVALSIEGSQGKPDAASHAQGHYWVVLPRTGMTCLPNICFRGFLVVATRKYKRVATS